MSKSHSGTPIWNREPFTFWDQATASKPFTKPCRFNGSSEDYWDWLKRIESLCGASPAATTRVGLTSHIQIPGTLFVQAFTRYWLKAANNAVFYMIPEEIADAIHGTHLTWVDADVFANLPDAMGILLESPGPGFQIYSSGQGDSPWHDVTDLLLLRVKDPDSRARIADNLNIDPETPNLQLFFWIAGTTGNGKVGSMNWGVFHVDKNMRLNHLGAGLEGVLDKLRAQAEHLVQQQAFLEPLRGKQTERDVIKALNKTVSDSQRDLLEGGEAQKASLANCMNFLAKFVIISNCDWFKGLLERVPPPGVRAMPHKARKLWEQYGERLRVHLPDGPDTAEEEAAREAEDGHTGHRKSPVRHFVPGFLRNQPYGPGRALRRIVWVRPFWRGEIQVAGPPAPPSVR